MPVLAERAGALLSETPLSDEAIAEAARASLEVVDPPSDIRASAEYRRHLVPVYVRRVLASMRHSASGAQPDEEERT